MENESSACNMFQVKAINYLIRVQGLETGYFHMESAVSFYGFKS